MATDVGRAAVALNFVEPRRNDNDYNTQTDFRTAEWLGQGGGRHMDGEVGMESDLLDVTGISLEQLDTLPDSVLGASLRRILTENARMLDHYAAFLSAI